METAHWRVLLYLWVTGQAGGDGPSQNLQLCCLSLQLLVHTWADTSSPVCPPGSTSSSFLSFLR